MIHYDLNKKVLIKPIEGSIIDDDKHSLTVIEKDKVIHIEENFKEVLFNTTYFRDLTCLLTNEETGETRGYRMPPVMNVSIEIHTPALGDQIAWMPIIDLFQKRHDCKVYVCSYTPELFSPFYPNLTFKQIDKKDRSIRFTKDEEVHRTYVLGYSFNGTKYDMEDKVLSPTDCRKLSLQDVAKHQLGMTDIKEEIKPSFKSNIEEPIVKGKYVVITTMATESFKLWHNPNGFPELIKYFKSKGYKVVDVGDISDNLEGTVSMNGKLEWNELMNIIENADLFVSGSNGLSWLAWALGQKVVTVDNITEEWAVFKHTKIDNKKVCNGCWNDLTLNHYGREQHYCPRGKNFECTKSITPRMVINAIRKNKLI